MAGRLSIVASPIGNLEDITFRAVRVLGEADVVLAEDTRTTAKLIAHYDIPHKEMVSFFEGNEAARLSQAINYLTEGKHVVLISESGTPLVSDPGFKLVREAIKLNIPVETIPGPSAVVAALTVSGLPSNTFVFLGFLPRKKSHVEKLLQEVKSGISQHVRTVVFYESPHRILSSLENIALVFGDIEVAVARELTKVYEEVWRGNVRDAVTHFTKVHPRGEFTVVFSTQI